MDTSAMINIMDTLQTSYGYSYPTSIILISVSLRLLHIPLKAFFKVSKVILTYFIVSIERWESGREIQGILW